MFPRLFLALTLTVTPSIVLAADYPVRLKPVDLIKSKSSVTQVGFFNKHKYCLVCNNGARMNCSVPVGGEAGRAMCGARGLVQCGGGHVDYNNCP